MPEMAPESCITVRTKVSNAELVPSETVTVMVAVPQLPAAGMTFRVRLASLPPRTRLAGLFGTRVVLLEVAVTVREPGAVSTSPTVKLKLPV